MTLTKAVENLTQEAFRHQQGNIHSDNLFLATKTTKTTKIAWRGGQEKQKRVSPSSLVLRVKTLFVSFVVFVAKTRLQLSIRDKPELG